MKNKTKSLEEIVKDDQHYILTANVYYAVSWDGARTMMKWRKINLTHYELSDVKTLSLDAGFLNARLTALSFGKE